MMMMSITNWASPHEFLLTYIHVIVYIHPVLWLRWLGAPPYTCIAYKEALVCFASMYIHVHLVGGRI